MCEANISISVPGTRSVGDPHTTISGLLVLDFIRDPVAVSVQAIHKHGYQTNVLIWRQNRYGTEMVA